MSAPKSSTEQQDPHVPRTLSEALVTEHVEELKESFEEVLDKIDVGPFHICLMLICGGSLLADAMEILLITFVQRKIMADLHIDIVQMSSLTSVVFLGMLLGAIAIGNFADQFGRKYALLFALLLNSVFGIATALSSSYPMLLLFRFFVGIGCGGIHVVYTYFLEFLPVKRCGRYHTVLTGFWTIGILLQCCLAYACRDYPWKVLVGVSVTPCVFFFVCSIFIPESPRFLYIKKRTTELNTLMHRIARFNGVLRSVFPHDFTIQPFNAESHTEDDAPKISLMEHARYLLGSQNRTLTIVLWGIWFIIAEIYYGAILLAPSIKITNTEVIDIAVMSLSDIVGSMGTFLGVTVIGKENAIRSGSLAVGFSILVLALDDIASSVYFACLFIARFTSCTCLNTLFLYTPGAYPTKHRSTALGLCAAIARIAGSITPLIAQGLGDTNRPLAAVIYAVSSMICAVLCKFLPEKSRMMQDTIE